MLNGVVVALGRRVELPKAASSARIREVEAARSVEELVKSMRWTAFNARKMGEAREVLSEMVKPNGSFNFLGLAGALVPAGLRKILVEMVRRKWVSVIVSSGANVTHDLSMAFGARHFQIKGRVSDYALRKRGLCRIYDFYTTNEGFVELERRIGRLLREIPAGQYGSHELLGEIGARLRDEGSILRAAHEANVKVLVPAFTDSILGLHVWMFSRFHGVKVDPFKDLDYILDLQFELRSRRAKTGAIILGGGVPKNFILQSSLFAEKPLDYALQITTDRPEFGGLSGATLEEAVSWGKISRNAKACTVYCDATIALPVLFSSMRV
ncbi:MAG: deoxyhypusine synthase family protein [Candidatus Brockarchaeota archaeon]|nr:deoxyhypusine synthase family protein [Candidatus Brockarchaeota archaeon]